MILILKRISPSTLVRDLENFIAPALKGGLFAKSGHLESITIHMLKEAGTHITEYNALIRVEPNAVGKRVIKLLNRKRLNGKPINIAEYHFRHRDNDRRQNRYRKLNSRRLQDRRRLGLGISDITDQKETAPINLHAMGWKSDSSV